MRRLHVCLPAVLLLAISLASCGGETPAVTVTVGQTEASTDQAAGGTETTKGDESPIQILAGPKVVYMPNQIGGKYHTAFAVLKNTGGDDLDVQAQFSMEDGKGLVGNADANLTILAGQEGVLIAEAIDLPRPFKNGEVGLATSTSEGWVTADALVDPKAITIENVKLKPGGEWEDCSFTAKVTNNTADKQSVRIAWVGFKNGDPLTAGYTYPDLFPKTPKVVDATMMSPAMCPKGVDEVRAYWSPAF